MDWTIEGLKDLRACARALGGDLDRVALIAGRPRSEVNRALDALLGRESDDDLGHAVAWLNGQGAAPKAAARGKSKIPFSLKALFR